MRAYTKAFDETPPPKSTRLPASALAALIANFYESADFRLLRKSTQGVYRQMLERLRDEHGQRLVKDVRALVDKRAETAHAANNLLKRLPKLLDLVTA